MCGSRCEDYAVVIEIRIEMLQHPVHKLVYGKFFALNKSGKLHALVSFINLYTVSVLEAHSYILHFKLK